MSTWKLASHFSELGMEVAVFSFAKTGHKSQSFCRLYAAGRASGLEGRENLMSLVQALNEFKPSVVINQMPYEHLIGKVLKENRRYLLLGCLRNTLYSVKNNIDQYGQSILPKYAVHAFRTAVGRKILLWLHRRRHRMDLEQILETYDYFVMFAPPNLEELEYFVPGYNRSKIKLIPNSIPFVPEEVPRKEKRILWLGRVTDEQKRADLVPELWERVSQALPDWSLDVVGDGPYLEQLKSQVKNKKLPRVCFHGRQVSQPYYRKAAIFAMTSAWEGFPNTLIEAQSFGAFPIVFDSYPIASWIVQDRENGILVPPFDVAAMGESIVSSARSRDLISLQQVTQESARKFCIDNVGKEWLELFNVDTTHSSFALKK